MPSFLSALSCLLCALSLSAPILHASDHEPSNEPYIHPLRYTKLHQEADGRWNADRADTHCDLPEPTPGSDVYGKATDLVVTCYALLSYLSNGYGHNTPSRYRFTVKKGVKWLQQQQAANGRFSQTEWIHALATMTLAEAYIISGDAALKEPTVRAIDIIKQDHISYKDRQWGWPTKATANSTLCDTRASTFAIMALKSGRAAALDTKDSLKQSKQWFEAAFKAANTNKKIEDPYEDRALFPRYYSPKTGQASELGKDYGLTVAAFLNYTNGDIMLETLANEIMAQHSAETPLENPEMLWLDSLGLFQVGGKHWQTWNKTTRDRVIEQQDRSKTCLHGSVNPAGKVAPFNKLGRVATTALNDLHLTIYYAYIPNRIKK